jgi:AmiR/NasT family two-component response regulator
MPTKAIPLPLQPTPGPHSRSRPYADCVPSAVITESDPGLREQLVTILSEMGIEVAGDAAIPSHAHALIRSMRPDLAILDADIAARMEELGNIAREAARLGCRVLLTARVPNSYEVSALVGVFPVIRKPFAAVNVHRAVAQALNRP